MGGFPEVFIVWIFSLKRDVKTSTEQSLDSLTIVGLLDKHTFYSVSDFFWSLMAFILACVTYLNLMGGMKK